jgi:hypothetical protein
MDEVADRLSREQIAKLQAATANRPSEAERIEAKYMGMIARKQFKEAEEYLSVISRIKGGSAGVGGERNDIAAVKAEQAALQKEVENPLLSKEARAAKQKQLDATYVRLRELSGTASPKPPSSDKVPPPPPGFKLN